MFLLVVFTIISFIVTISLTSSFFFAGLLVAVLINTTFLGKVVKFGSVAAVSVELDVLAGGVEEVEALGVSEVDTVQDGHQQKEDDDDEDVQPGEVGLDLTNAVLLGSHFFGRSLTARGAGPAARILRVVTATSTLGGLRGALSGRAVASIGAAGSGGGEVVAALVVVAIGLLGVLRALGLVAADARGGEAGRIPQALVEALGGADVDLVGAADPQAHFLCGVPLAGSELAAVRFAIADALGGFALDVGGVPDALGVEPARGLSGVTAEAFDADTLIRRVRGEPAAERVGGARRSGGVDGAARGDASTLLVGSDGSTVVRDEEIIPRAASDLRAFIGSEVLARGRRSDSAGGHSVVPEAVGEGRAVGGDDLRSAASILEADFFGAIGVESPLAVGVLLAERFGEASAGLGVATLGGGDDDTVEVLDGDLVASVLAEDTTAESVGSGRKRDPEAIADQHGAVVALDGLTREPSGELVALGGSGRSEVDGKTLAVLELPEGLRVRSPGPGARARVDGTDPAAGLDGLEADVVVFSAGFGEVTRSAEEGGVLALGLGGVHVGVDSVDVDLLQDLGSGGSGDGGKGSAHAEGDDELAGVGVDGVGLEGDVLLDEVVGFKSVDGVGDIRSFQQESTEVRDPRGDEAAVHLGVSDHGESVLSAVITLSDLDGDTIDGSGGVVGREVGVSEGHDGLAARDETGTSGSGPDTVVVVGARAGVSVLAERGGAHTTDPLAERVVTAGDGVSEGGAGLCEAATHVGEPFAGLGAVAVSLGLDGGAASLEGALRNAGVPDALGVAGAETSGETVARVALASSGEGRNIPEARSGGLAFRGSGAGDATSAAHGGS